ncbi:MAG: hypothetical protein ACOYLQ_08005 [Hyphomicrobiaceae bacterium]
MRNQIADYLLLACLERDPEAAAVAAAFAADSGLPIEWTGALVAGEITPNGLGLTTAGQRRITTPTPKQVASSWADWSMDLPAMVGATRRMLRGMRTVSTGGRSSYLVKHLVEHITGVYVVNGAAILAAVLEGVPMRADRPNPTLLVAEADVRAIERTIEIFAGRRA